MALKTRQQLADEFGINVRTLHRWLSKWNIKLPGGLIRPADQDAIYGKLGKPGEAIAGEYLSSEKKSSKDKRKNGND